MTKDKRKARIKQLKGKIDHALAVRKKQEKTGKGHLVRQFENAIKWHEIKLKKEG